jgi:hypothetical protein
MSVKTLASWSEHVLSMHPGISSGPVALWMLTCLKVLLTLAIKSKITQSSGTTGALICMVQCCLRALKTFSSSGRIASLGISRLFFPFVVRDSLQTLPHLSSVRAGVVWFDFSPVLTLPVWWLTFQIDRKAHYSVCVPNTATRKCITCSWLTLKNHDAEIVLWYFLHRSGLFCLTIMSPSICRVMFFLFDWPSTGG